MSEIDIVLVANDPDVSNVRVLNSKSLGKGGRMIPFIEQVDVCWKTLFDNWNYDKLPFTAYQLHTEPLGPRMLSVLEPYVEKGLRVLSHEPLNYHPRGKTYNRAVAFIHPALQSPVRIVIDADILWLGTPPLDLSVPFAGMWAGQALGDQALCEWAVINTICGVPYDPRNYHVEDGRPHNVYHLGDDRLTWPSQFNMGLIQLHRSICPQFYNLFTKYVPLLYKNRGGSIYGTRWLAPQYAMSVAGRQVAKDQWRLLPRGVNFLPVFMDTGDAERAGVEITAYHYAQSDELGRGLEPDIYGAYFHPAPVYLKPEELLYRTPDLGAL